MSVVKALLEIAARLVEELSYLGVFITMALESACVPIPSELVMPLAGYVFCDTALDVLLLGLLGATANLAGSIAAYSIGATAGVKLLARLKRLPYFSRELERCEDLFSRYGDLAVAISRVLPGVRTFISLPAGAFKMKARRFAVLTFLGSVPWNLLLTYVGFLLGENWALIEEYMVYADYAVAAGLLFLLVFVLVIPKVIMKIQSLQEPS